MGFGRMRTRSAGFGMLGWLFLAVLLYLLASLSIGFSTNDQRCGIGQQREWRYVPPGWVCR
jgi:hypothetical protein